MRCQRSAGRREPGVCRTVGPDAGRDTVDSDSRRCQRYTLSGGITSTVGGRPGRGPGIVCQHTVPGPRSGPRERGVRTSDHEWTKSGRQAPRADGDLPRRLQSPVDVGGGTRLPLRAPGHTVEGVLAGRVPEGLAQDAGGGRGPLRGMAPGRLLREGRGSLR